MRKLRILLTCGSSAALLCASVTMIMEASNIYTYAFVALGMALSVLAWIVGKREIRNRRLVFAPIAPSATELEWMEWRHQTARDIATQFEVLPQLLEDKP